MARRGLIRFSLHFTWFQRKCRYIIRPPLANGRLSLTPQGRVHYTLKTPYRDGTTHVVFGVFAPHSG